MITKRIWRQQKGSREWIMEGWYLFGFIPLYTRDLTARERRS